MIILIGNSIDHRISIYTKQGVVVVLAKLLNGRSKGMGKEELESKIIAERMMMMMR